MKPILEKFEKLSSRILMLIDFYRAEVIKKILNNNRFIKEDEKYFYTIILKTIDSLDGANIFIRNFNNIRSFQVPLFIIIRAILNDIIISEYIIVNSSDNQEQVKLINRINFEHIKYIISSIKIESKIRKWSEQEKQRKYIEIKRAYQKYYEKNGNEKLTEKIKTNAGSLVDSILEKSTNHEPYQLIGVAYILYNTFSKLEHFGELSFSLVHLPYQDNKQPSLNHLFSSIEVIVAALNNYCRKWENLEIDFEKQKKLEIEILKMAPDFR